MSGRLCKADLHVLANVVCLDMLQYRWKPVSSEIERRIP